MYAVHASAATIVFELSRVGTFNRTMLRVIVSTFKRMVESKYDCLLV